MEVVLTPTYSGCPATEVIEQRASTPSAPPASAGARHDAARAGLDHRLDQRRGPPQAARLRHRAARPGGTADGGCRSASWPPRGTVPCPRCGSARTERLSAFGSTACKSLYRCLDACREPFEHFKPI
jgi:ring-1,2-phenylacetyl-CoA epoxidase subunit PaaD